MKQIIMTHLLDIHQITEAAIQHHKNDKDQAVLDAATNVRNIAWAIKEEIFKIRFLDGKINKKGVKLMARARHVSTSLDDLLDLL